MQGSKELNHPKKNIAILGSTGSIGTQALDIIRNHPDIFQVEILTAQDNADLLIAQAVEFHPNIVVIGNEYLYDKVFSSLDPLGIKIYCGAKSIASVVEMDGIDLVLTGLVGYSGLLPTIKAIQAGKQVALANKETLVVAGELIMKLVQENKTVILPVDSEHSAIFQCLAGEYQNKIHKVILTASGGPFRGKDLAFLKNVTKAQALSHPNWVMGSKITIDSASLMNKGLEVIEAKWLFDLKNTQIEVVIHPQSIVHSLIEFEDGSIKAQLGLPNMRIPIQYALNYPFRLKTDGPRFHFKNYPNLSFEQPDLNTFRNLGLAFEAMEKGGNMPCILNAANEIAVAQFLKDEISFVEISDVIENCMAKVPYIATPSYEDYVNTDKETRFLAKTIHSTNKNF
jgi:1-deoxy-D-xylulose-5-phosphate reductoisomerase